MIFKLKKNKSLHLAHAESGYLCCFKTNLNPATTEANNIVPFAKKATGKVVEETVEQTAIQAGAKAGAGKLLSKIPLVGAVAGLADFFINAEPTGIGTFGTTAENTFNFANNPAETLTMALNSAGELRLKLGNVFLPGQYPLINLARDVNIGFDGETYTLYNRGETIKLALGDGIEKKGDVLEIQTGGKTTEIKMPVGYKKPDSRTKLANGDERATPSLEEQKQKTEKQKAIDDLNKANSGTRASLGSETRIAIIDQYTQGEIISNKTNLQQFDSIRNILASTEEKPFSKYFMEVWNTHSDSELIKQLIPEVYSFLLDPDQDVSYKLKILNEMEEWPIIFPKEKFLIIQNITFPSNQKIEKNLHTLILGETTRLKLKINLEGLKAFIKVDSMLLKGFFKNMLSEENGNAQLKTAHKMLEAFAHIDLFGNASWKELEEEISNKKQNQQFRGNADFLNKDDELLKQYHQLLSFQEYNQTEYLIKPLKELLDLDGIISLKNKELEKLEYLTSRSESQNKRIESLRKEISILTDPNFPKYLSGEIPAKLQNYIKSFKSHYIKQIRKAIHSQLILGQIQSLNKFLLSSCHKKLIDILGYSVSIEKLSPDLTNAVLFYAKLQVESLKGNSQSYPNNIKYLSQLIKDHFNEDNSSNWIFNNTEAQKWKNQIQRTFPEANIGNWRSSYSLNIKGFEFTVEIDPLRYLQMGNLMKNPYSCLHLMAGNFASAVSNGIDCNKVIVWAKDEEGEIMGRQLIALTDHGLVRYKPYYAQNYSTFDKEFDLFILSYAQHLGIPISTAETKRSFGPDIGVMDIGIFNIFNKTIEIEVPQILSDYWLDDGALTEPINTTQNPQPPAQKQKD